METGGLAEKGGNSRILPVRNLREDFDLSLAHPGVGRKLGYQDLLCHGLFEALYRQRYNQLIC
jgi:hypothetical protein